jgi:G3E family GTPase
MIPTIPITLLAGYLGAGKTTILNHVLSCNHGLKIAVLVNDFGKINIDAGLIKNASGDTIELTNGCVCCSVGDDLGASLSDLTERPVRPEHVIIEASGVTDPKRVAMHSGHWPGFHLSSIILAVDAEHIRTRAKDKFVGQLVETQIKAADTIALTKSDLIGTDDVASTCLWLSNRNPTARLVPATFGVLPIDIVFGTLRRKSDAPAHISRPYQDFDTALWRPSAAVDLDKLSAEIARAPVSIQRVKGTGVDQETGTLTLIQAVGRRCETSVVQMGMPHGLVVISVGDPAAAAHLCDRFDACCLGASTVIA